MVQRQRNGTDMALKRLAMGITWRQRGGKMAARQRASGAHTSPEAREREGWRGCDGHNAAATRQAGGDVSGAFRYRPRHTPEA